MRVNDVAGNVCQDLPSAAWWWLRKRTMSDWLITVSITMLYGTHTSSDT
jgi:hypothetical protein